MDKVILVNLIVLTNIESVTEGFFDDATPLDVWSDIMEKRGSGVEEMRAWVSADQEEVRIACDEDHWVYDIRVGERVNCGKGCAADHLNGIVVVRLDDHQGRRSIEADPLSRSVNCHWGSESMKQSGCRRVIKENVAVRLAYSEYRLIRCKKDLPVWS